LLIKLFVTTPAHHLLVAALLVVGISALQSSASQPLDIYHEGWNDLNKNGQKDPYEDPSLEVEKRIDDLLSRMTIEEKTCQMATLYGLGRDKEFHPMLPTEEWKTKVFKDGIANIDEHLQGSPRNEYEWPPSKHADALNQVQRFFIEETRMGIPVDFSNEGIFGVKNIGATCFPVQLGQGSTWDKELVARIGHITGKEAKALGYSNIYAPILDLAREPRWGRVAECYSEEPFLVSRLGVAMAKGIQAEGIVSSPKHFVLYSIPGAGRDNDQNTDPAIARREMHELHLAPFQAAVVEAGVLGVMNSYNEYDGIPIASSYEFLTGFLRNQWGFKGYVVSDSGSITHMYSKHKIAKDYEESALKAVQAGLDVRTKWGNPTPSTHVHALRKLYAEGRLTEQELDDRVGNVLRVKYWQGLFDKPYKTEEEMQAGDQLVHCPAHEAVALEASRKSIVLLKNEGQLLPLDKSKTQSILVTGPNADVKSNNLLAGHYGPIAGPAISVLQGIQDAAASGTQVHFAQGCSLTDENFPDSEIFPKPPSQAEQARIDEAVKYAREVDVAVVVVGDAYRLAGENNSRTSLDLPGNQLELIQAIHATGTPTVVVLLNGRPMTINWTDRYIPAIVEGWYPGEFGGQAIAEVLFGDINPSGKLPITFVKTVGQLPAAFPFKPGAKRIKITDLVGKETDTRVQGLLYPFGHGLSYSNFAYSNLTITPESPSKESIITVQCDITNTSERDGDEVPQLYINDQLSSVTTYIQVLRGFERVHLPAGATQTVTFELEPLKHLALLNQEMHSVVEPGVFEVMIGSSSEDLRLKGSFEILP
jgi:beta-glucosidase